MRLICDQKSTVGRHEVRFRRRVVRDQKRDHVLFLRRIHVAIGIRRQADIVLPLLRILGDLIADFAGVDHDIGTGEHAFLSARLRSDAAHDNALAGLMRFIGISGENFRRRIAVIGADEIGARFDVR